MKKTDNRYLKFVLGLLLGNLLAVAISFMVTSIFSTAFHGNFEWIGTVISIGFYFFFLYHEGWVNGATDYNLILHNHMKKRPQKGVVCGMLATIPGLILAILAIGVSRTGVHIYTFLEQDIAIYLYRFWYAPMSIIFPALNKALFLHLLPPLLMPIVTAFGYQLGLSQIRLSDYLVYEREEDKEGEE